MPFLPVAARSLHRRRVRLRDVVLERASLFPFFDREGRVRALMLVRPPARRIVMLDGLVGSPPGGRRSELARVRWSGDIQLDVAFAALRDVDAGGIAAVAGLWHYDPWWVLRQACFEGHPAVPALKATNCAGGFLKPVYGCYFSRDLSRLTGVATQSKASSGLAAVDHTFVRFTPQLLPEKPAAARPADPHAVKVPPARLRRTSRHDTWTLDPFWLREDWRLPRSHRPSP